jgi:hypothetical protein
MKIAQDTYCAQALAGQWAGLGEFPSELALEALVEVLRGKFKVSYRVHAAIRLSLILE